jgi:hypothetical protein
MAILRCSGRRRLQGRHAYNSESRPRTIKSNGKRAYLTGILDELCRKCAVVAASVLALVISLATVSGHALLVARAKAVDALRYE